MGNAIDLAADAAALARQRGGVRAEVEEEARDLTLTLVLDSACEEAMQSEAAHQRAVDEEKLSRHGGAPRSPAGPARSAARRSGRSRCDAPRAPSRASSVRAPDRRAGGRARRARSRRPPRA